MDLQDRLDDRTRDDLIAAYRAGTTAASIAAAHGLSIRSVKRLLASAGARRKQLPDRRHRRAPDAGSPAVPGPSSHVRFADGNVRRRARLAGG